MDDKNAVLLKPNEELKHLTIQFMATQKLSLQVQDNLEKLIVQYNSWECEMFPNFTYRTCLEEMKSSFKTNLSDDVLKHFYIKIRPNPQYFQPLRV